MGFVRSDDGEVGACEICDVADGCDDLVAVVGEIAVGAVGQKVGALNNGKGACTVLKVDEVEVLLVVNEEHGVLESSGIASAAYGLLAINEVDGGTSGVVGERRRIELEEIEAVGESSGTSEASDFISVGKAGDTHQAHGVLNIV